MTMLFDNFGSEIKTLIEFSVLPFAVFHTNRLLCFLLCFNNGANNYTSSNMVNDSLHKPKCFLLYKYWL